MLILKVGVWVLEVPMSILKVVVRILQVRMGVLGMSMRRQFINGQRVRLRAARLADGVELRLIRVMADEGVALQFLPHTITELVVRMLRKRGHEDAANGPHPKRPKRSVTRNSIGEAHQV